MASGGAAAAAAPAFRAGAGGGRGGGAGGGLADRADSIEAARLAQQIDAAGAQLGDLFEYKLKEPVTIRKNQSALVPILGGDVQAEKVSLWNAASGGTRALRAVWVTNSTGLTLDGGSFSVIEGQAFAGEGLIEPLKAGERRLLSYAMDLGVTDRRERRERAVARHQSAGRARAADSIDRGAAAPDLFRAQRGR